MYSLFKQIIKNIIKHLIYPLIYKMNNNKDLFHIIIKNE